MSYQVSLVEMPPQTVLRAPVEISPELLSTGIVSGMRQVAEIAERAGLTANGASTITYHRELPSDEVIAVDFGLPIEPAPMLGPSSGATLVIEAPTLVARTCHRGGYDQIDNAYRALRDWLYEARYQPTGPPTEAYLIGPDEVSDPRSLITEIRIPVAPMPILATHLDSAFDDAVAATRSALQEHGFLILTSTDVQALLRGQIGAHIEEYLILGVCLPRLTARAVTGDRQAGVLLPWSVVIRSDDTGVLVEAADPTLLANAVARTDLDALADATRRLLAETLDDLRAPAIAAIQDHRPELSGSDASH